MSGKKGKKLLLLLLAVLVLIPAGNCASQSAGVFRFEDWVCVENQTGLTLRDYLGNDTELLIPSELDGRPVTQLGNDLFMGNMQLKRVVIPGTVTAIGSNAFNSCTALEEVQLSFSIKTIAAGTFRNCVSLKEIVLPKTVTSIGNNAFQNCRSLTTIYMTSVQSIGESSFEGCEVLTRVVYGNRLYSVGAFAFRNTQWLEQQTDEFVMIGRGILIKWNGSGREVTLPWGTVMISGVFAENETIETVKLPDTVRNVGQYAFRNAVNLSSVNIPQYVTTIGASAFEGCRSLTGLELPATVSSIGGSAFRNCERLASVNIPAKVKTIAARTFAGSPLLGVISIPESVTKIDKTAFQGSDNVVLEAGWGSVAEAFAAENNVCFRSLSEETENFVYARFSDGIHILRYTGNQAVAEIPEKIEGVPVTIVEAGAFLLNGCVRQVNLPASLKVIGDRAFSEMDALESVRIPAGLKSMGAHAFSGSHKLRAAQLPRRLVTIGEDPFDAESDTMLCAWEGSAAESFLLDAGYTVSPYSLCSEITGMALSPDPDKCPGNPEALWDTESTLLRIPDGVSLLSADLLDHAGEKVVLFVPDSVEEIDENILSESRSLVIAAAAGTAADAFAAAHGLRFILWK